MNDGQSWDGRSGARSAASGLRAVVVPRPGFVLSGTLDLPRSRGPWPVVLIVPGGGPTDADGNVDSPAAGGMRHRPYAQLAASLSRHGYAVARFGKSGPEASARGRWRQVEERAGDCFAAVEALRRESSLDKRRVVLMGHGEGGLVALAAARAARPAAVVLLATPAKPMHEIVAEQLLREIRGVTRGPAGQWPGLPGVAGFRDRLVRAPDGASVEYAGLPLPPAAVRYMKSLYRVRPADLAAGLQVPALVVQGSRDTVVGRDNGATLALALPRGDLRVIDGMGHGLTLAGGFGAGASTIPAATPLHPLLIWTLLDWLRRMVPPHDLDADLAEATGDPMACLVLSERMSEAGGSRG